MSDDQHHLADGPITRILSVDDVTAAMVPHDEIRQWITRSATYSLQRACSHCDHLKVDVSKDDYALVTHRQQYRVKMRCTAKTCTCPRDSVVDYSERPDTSQSQVAVSIRECKRQSTTYGSW